MKKVISIVLLFIAVSTSMRGSGSNSLGNSPLPPEVVGNATEPQRPSTDYQPSGPGFISLVDAETLALAKTKSNELLALAPNDASGQQSPWYATLQTWATGAGQASTSKTHSSVFNLIPAMADFFSRDIGNVNLAPSLNAIQSQMEACGTVIIKAIAAHVEQSNGVVDATTLNKFARVYASGHFFQESEWESEKPMIDAGGIMILDANAVVTQLMAGPWQQAKRFLGGHGAASSFFSRYSSTGDGLAILKTGYSNNQTAIDAKFNQLLAWVTQQEQQTGEN